MRKNIKITKPKTSLMCPPGSHVVRGHYRICKSGTRTWVDTHIRRNRGKKIMLLSENLLYLYWNNKKAFDKIKAVKGFHSHHELDPVIHFWLNYWKSQGLKFPKGLTPLHIKCLIAVESSFRPGVHAKSSTAMGLMQLLAPTLQRLKGVKKNNYREIRNHYLSLSKKEALNPVLNIAAGIRWLSNKHEQLLRIKRIKDKGIKSTIKYYHSWDKDGEKYAKKILKLYNESK